MKSVSIKSLMDITFLSGVSLSQDAKHTAYVQTKQNEKENTYESRIMLRDNVSGKVIILTNSGKESSFIWQDNETILFPAQREKKSDEWADSTDFYAISISGGEAQKAFSVPLNVSDIKKISENVFCVMATVDLNKPEEQDDDYKDYHVFEEAPFWGNGRGFISRVRSALFIYDVKENKLTKVSGRFFNVDDYDVKDNRVVYCGCEYSDKISQYSEMRMYDISSGKTDVCVPFGKYNIRFMRFTESGMVIAASTMDKYGSGQLADFYRADSMGKNMSLAWHSDGTHIGPDTLGDTAYGMGKTVAILGDDVYFIGLNKFNQEVYKLASDNSVERLTFFGSSVSLLDVVADNVYFIAQEKDGLQEMYKLADGSADKVTNVNEAFLSEHFVSKCEYIPFTDSDGYDIDGWVLKPYGYSPDKKYPAILEIHGGPRCAYTTGFYHEMQAFCGAGYFVFFCNPRGSEGYGEEFADLREKYGDIDYKDLMEFTDHVLNMFPQIDSMKLGASGGSYGGFMCNWIEGHTDRFAAIASQRSVSNWVADFGASEIGVTFDKNEMGADPWTDMQKMWDQSPLKYANNAVTPILFIHSMCDYNCTLDQGIEMFTAMKYFGVPSRMCVFEGENHSLSRSGKPRHRIRRLAEILGWYDRYLK